MIEYKFNHYSKAIIGKDGLQTSYDWCIFMNENETVLKTIRYVKYILHPSFSSRERIMNNEKDKFALYLNGYSSFNVMIEVMTKEGITYKLTYYLNLIENNWPEKTIEREELDTESLIIYDVIKDSKFNWRKLSTIVDSANLPVETIQSSINKLQDMNLVRKEYYKTIDGQDLFGVTSKVGKMPE
jgi:transcription initiation factor IIF auxiliary subunit